MNTILNIIIGFAAVYGVFALMASWIQELLATLFSLRAKNLITGLENMMADPKTNKALAQALAQKVLQQPSIAAAVSRQNSKPSYISAQQFSLAVTGILNAGGGIAGTASDAFKQLVAGIATLDDSRLKQVLTQIATQASGDYDAAIAGIEAWYDDQMDRVSGWYKRNAQLWLLAIGAALSIGFNLDAVRLLHGFEGAPLAFAAGDFKNDQAAQNQAINTVLQYPCIGWPAAAPSPMPAASVPPAAKTAQKVATDAAQSASAAAAAVCNGFQDSNATRALGVLLSTIALMLGAPFWFNSLSRFVNVRATGPKPAKSSSDG